MSQGKIVQIIGAVVDVEFPRHEVPKVYDALKVQNTDITLEVQHQMPLPLNQLVWRHHILRRPAQASAAESGASWQVMVQAARQFHVDELLRVLRDVGLKVDAVQGDCAARWSWG